MGKRMTIKELKEMINFMKDDAIVELIDGDVELNNEMEQERIASCRSLLNSVIADYRKIVVKLADTLADGYSVSGERRQQMITYGHRINKLINECFLEYETLRRSHHIKGLIFEMKTNHDMINGVIDIYRDYADETRQKLINGLDSLMGEIIKDIETNLL